MLHIFILTVFLLSCFDAHKVSYSNYKVYRIFPRNDEHLDFVKSLDFENKTEVSYWLRPRRPNNPVDVMVAPSAQERTISTLDNNNITYIIIVYDVQKLIDKEIPVRPKRASSITRFRINTYHDLEEIYAWFDLLARKYPKKVEVIVGGKSFEGREIKGIKLNSGDDKRSVFIEGGIHAREWISSATIICLIKWFLTSESSKVKSLAASYNWYFFPVFNPDGYVFTRTTDRLWRKNRAVYPHSNCTGVDLNRNWEYGWNDTEGASPDPCDDTYRGTAPLSEMESSTLSTYIKSIKDKLFAHISFHSYGQLLIFPYTISRNHSENYAKNYAIGSKAIEALSKKYKTTYQIGIASDILYTTVSGSSMDWTAAILQVPMSFTYELRPSLNETGVYGFFYPPDQIKKNSREVLDSLIAMFHEGAKVFL